jgi:hypothetical protein
MQLDRDTHGFGLNSDVVMGAVRQAARTALATSLHDVFQIAAALLFCATILALFLREIPLRKSNRRDFPVNDETPCEPDAMHRRTITTAPLARFSVS